MRAGLDLRGLMQKDHRLPFDRLRGADSVVRFFFCPSVFDLQGQNVKDKRFEIHSLRLSY